MAILRRPARSRHARNGRCRCSITASRRAWPTEVYNELGLEIPRLSWFDWAGFLAAWVGRGRLDRALDLAGRPRFKVS